MCRAATGQLDNNGMARSMTGFGKASGEHEGSLISIEVSAVNHRFLDVGLRTPSAWTLIENGLRDLVSRHVARGKLNVFVNRKRLTSGRQVVRFDREVAAQYVEAARELSHIMRTTEAISLDVLAQFEGVFYHEEKEDDLDEVRGAIEPLLEEALVQLNTMRDTEGNRTVTDMRGLISTMQTTLTSIEQRIPEVNRAYESRLRQRLDDLKADAGITEERLAVEVALMADKADVTEEVVRLKAHFDQAMSLLDSDTPIGRELNFIAQEMQREINTVGSKLRDVDVARDVIRLKSELEKLREQAQNIE